VVRRWITAAGVGAALAAAGCGASEREDAGAPVQQEPAYSVERTLAAFEQAGLPLKVRVRDGECLDPPAPEPGIDQVAGGCVVFGLDGEEPETLAAFLVPHGADSGDAAPNIMSVAVYTSAEAAHAATPSGDRPHTIPLTGRRTTLRVRTRENVVATCFECGDADVDRIERALAAL
jgi:hypothetical protein